ncbi:unnamed protein product, partial [Bubo scandiacus]
MAAGTGPGPGVEELAWSPGTAPRPPPGLEAKLGSLVLLLLLPLGCGLAPLCCFRQPPSAADARSPVLSLVSCFAGGVFLATCLLDLLPDYLASISAALEGLRITLQFPLPEFILAMGFFLVLVLEQVALAQREPPSSLAEETRALLPAGSIQTLPPPPSSSSSSSSPASAPSTRGGRPRRAAGAGAGAARRAGGAGAGAAGGRGGRAARLPGPAAAQMRRGLQPRAEAAAGPPAPAGRGRLPAALRHDVPVGRGLGDGGGGRRRAAAAPVPGGVGGVGGRDLPLHHFSRNFTPGIRGSPTSHPQGHLAPRWLRPRHRHPLHQDL